MSSGGASATLAGIERQLREMWADPAPGEAPRSRVCTMNLVVVTSTPGIAERYLPVVDEVMASIPARAIVVELTPDAREDALHGEAVAVGGAGGSQAPRGGASSERIRLHACGAVCARMASAVDLLLVPELPTALVWLGPVDVDDPLFAGLAANANRVILDTDYTSLPSLLRLYEWSSAEAGRPHVADLAWTRLALWQEMCARFFDEPELREHALGITRIEITQASDPGSRLGSAAALLVGWFATRLGWRIRHVGPVGRVERADGAPVTILLTTTPRPDGVAPTAMAGVVLEAERGGLHARGVIARDLASGLDPSKVDADVLIWKLDVALPSATEQTVRLGANKGARLLERTLHRPANDPALDEAIHFAEGLLKDGLVTI